MDKAKEKNDIHSYLTQNISNPNPFLYTKFKIPLSNENPDLVPLTPNKIINSGNTTPALRELNEEYKTLTKEKNRRKKKIRSLITERNDREYYLSLNTNQFKIKMKLLKKVYLLCFIFAHSLWNLDEQSSQWGTQTKNQQQAQAN